MREWGQVEPFRPAEAGGGRWERAMQLLRQLGFEVRLRLLLVEGGSPQLVGDEGDQEEADGEHGDPHPHHHPAGSCHAGGV